MIAERFSVPFIYKVYYGFARRLVAVLANPVLLDNALIVSKTGIFRTKAISIVVFL